MDGPTDGQTVKGHLKELSAGQESKNTRISAQ